MMNTKKLFLIGSFVLFSPAVWGGIPTAADSLPSPTPIAVLTLEGKGISSQESEILTERLRSTLVRLGRFKVLERSQMEAIMEEQGFQQTGCLTNECLVEAGRILGVRLMVSGTVGKIGASYAVDVRLFDVETSEIIRAVTRNHQGAIEALLTVMEDIAAELAGEEPPTENTRTPTYSPPAKRESPPDEILTVFDELTNSLQSIRFPFHHHHHMMPDLSWTPFQLGLVYPLQLFNEDTDVIGYRFNIVYGRNRSLIGIDNGIINEVNETAMGYQVGFYNQCGSLVGVQQGFLNRAGKVFGVQLGFINVAGELTGVQIGLLNYHTAPDAPIPVFPIINIGF
jgi:TolB-like protein